MTTTSLSPTRAVLLVAKREIVTRLRTKGFLIGIVVTLVAIAAFVGFQVYSNQDTGRIAIGTVGQAGAISEPLKTATAALGKEVKTEEVADPAAGEQRVRDGELDALVSGSPGALKVIVKERLDPVVRGALDGLVRQQALDAQLAQANVEPAQVAKSLANAKINLVTLQPEDPQRMERFFLGVGSVLLLLFGVMTYMQFVAQGVVEEKSSRVVELLLSSVRPWQLLGGKVLGIGIVALVNITIISGAALGGAILTDVLTVPNTGITTLLLALLWFLIGFFLFSTIAAAAASLVSRQEELNSVITPLIMVLMLVYVVSFRLVFQAGLEGKDSPTLETLSLIPPFSPILIPVRHALGLLPGWQLILAIVINLVAIAALTWLAGRIYANAVLRTGARVKLRDALRAS